MEESLALIVNELKANPLPINRYRNKSGPGRNQIFGVISHRSQPPDYSRICWTRPYLYKLLLDFGKAFVPFDITTIIVYQNFTASRHRNKATLGKTFIISTGDYKGGGLLLGDDEPKDVRVPIIADINNVDMAVEPFTGERFSLIYYKARKTDDIPAPSVELVNGVYVFMKGGVAVPMIPLRARKGGPTMTRTYGDVLVEFL